MTGPTNDRPSDEARLAELGAALADAVVAALPAWAAAQVTARAPNADPALVEAAAHDVVEDVETDLRTLLAADVDAQRVGPLAVVRRAAAAPTAVLAHLGVPVAARDPEQARLLPEDPYDLGPHRWLDLGEAVHEAGLAWGAGKAWVHRARHR